jgi:hypothetical protein
MHPGGNRSDGNDHLGRRQIAVRILPQSAK